MSIDPSFISAVLSAVGAYAASKFLEQKIKRRRELLIEQRKVAENLYQKSFTAYIESIQKQHPSISIKDFADALGHEYDIHSITPTVSGTFMSKEDIQNEIDSSIGALGVRIEEIERRFPAQDTVEKIASVNEAILAIQIENLTNTIQKLEEKILSRWDVAKIVFQIIAILCGIIGAVLALAKYFTSTT